MNSISISLKWFAAFIKRLLKKKLFLLTLLFIPIITLAMSVVSEEDSGIISVALASRDDDNPIYHEIVDELLGETSSMLFYECETADEAVGHVKSGDANCAWIFSDNYSESMRSYVKGDSSATLCEIVLKDDSILYQLSREKLFSLIYKHLSYEIFVDFMDRKDLDTEYANEVEYRKYFDEQKNSINDKIVDFVFLDAPEKTLDDVNYLTSPLRGLLAVAVLISCLASMLYSLDDESRGKYAMFPISKRFLLHIMAVLAAGFLVSIAVFAALYFSGLAQNVVYEILLLALYSVMVVGLCVFIGIICVKPSRLCILFPILIVATISLCPIFVNTTRFGIVKAMIPTNHYLLATTDSSKIKFMVIYIVAVYVLDVITYKVLNKE